MKIFTLAVTLKNARVATGKKLAELSKESGIPSGTLRRFESLDLLSLPGEERLKIIAKLYEKDLNELRLDLETSREALKEERALRGLKRVRD